MSQTAKGAGLILLVAAVLCLFQSVLLSLSSPFQRLPLDAREADALLDGVHSAEQDQRSLFRWSTGNTALHVYLLTSNSPLAFSFALGPPPPELANLPLELRVQGRVIAQLPIDSQPRRYHVLLPTVQPMSPISVRLQSPTVTVSPDIRRVGTRIEALALQRIGDGIPLPAPGAVVLQTLLLLLFAGTLRLLAPWSWTVVCTICIAIGLGAAFTMLPWLYALYCARLVVALGLLAGTTMIGLPLFTRMAAWKGAALVAQAVWGMALLACAVRLVGAVYPLFSAYDLTLNVERFLRVSEGSLVAFNESFEFKGNLTVYPAGPYLFLLLGSLFGLAPALVVQVGISLIDGWSVLLVGLLAHRLGARSGVCIIAALLMAFMPISLTSLYYGHTAQIFGQTLMLPLALLLLNAFTRPCASSWLGVAAVLSMALLTHIGVAVLAVTWLGLFWFVLVLQRRHGATTTAFTRMLGGSIMIGLVFVYAPFVQMHLEQLMSVHTATITAKVGPAYGLIAKAYWIAYTPLGILLLAPGCVLMMRFLTYPGKQLVACWLGAAGIFAGIELVTGLQVRYLVFLTPLIAIAAATALNHLRIHSRLGWCAATGMIAFWIVQGVMAWYSGIFANIAPSMIPLLR